MMPKNLKERFSEFETGYFSRIDNKHNLDIHIGTDYKGRKAIKLRAIFNPISIKGTKLIDVKQFKKDKYNTLQFSLNNDEAENLFYIFCEDLVESSQKIDNENEGYIFIINRFSLWKKMFLNGPMKFLSESEIIGLIGEILFLKNFLIPKYGETRALMGWSGQELTHKDFSYDNLWYEIKSILNKAISIKISSYEQLDSKNDGYLIVNKFEKMSKEYNGINLNTLVIETMKMLNDENNKGLFFSKISSQGFIIHDYYNDFIYEFKERKNYLIQKYSDFPSIKKSTINKAIIKVQYEIALNEIKKFQIELENK